MRIFSSFLRPYYVPVLFASMVFLLFCHVGVALGSNAFPLSSLRELNKPDFSIEPVLFSQYSTATRGFFSYNAISNSRMQDKIHVMNNGNERGSVMLYAVDATTGQASGTIFLNRMEPRHDVGAWISISQQQVTLDAGQSLDVPFSVNVPEQVRPGQHGGGIIAETLDQLSADTSQKQTVKLGVRSLVALGVLINLPGQTYEKLSATGIHFDITSSHQRVLLDLANEGTQLLHPAGNLQIFDAKGARLQDIEIKMNTFLPQTAIAYPLYIQHKALQLGTNYTARLTLNYGSNHALNYNHDFNVPLSAVAIISKDVASLVVSDPNDFFRALTPWHYIIILSLLFLLVSALIFWCQNIYRTTLDLKSKGVGRNKSSSWKSKDEDRNKRKGWQYL